MFQRGSITLFRVRSVPVRAHWSLLLVFPYLALVFAGRFRDTSTLPALPLLWGLVVAVGLFASVALHELAHTLVAMRLGGRVREITLMLLGGVSQIERPLERPAAEALMAAAGPALSIVLGLGLGLLARLPMPDAARLALRSLASINIVLGVFNMLPAFPMDGGRVLRAALASRLGFARATRVAARVGKVAAVLFGIVGALAGNFLLLFIALFIFSGAEYEARAYELRDALAHLQLREVMATPAPQVPLDASLAAALDVMRRLGRRELVAVDEAGHPAGIVRAGLVAALPLGHQASVRVRDLGRRLSEGVTIAAADAPAADALESAARKGAQYVIVLERRDDGATSLAGVVGPAEIENAMLLRGGGPRSPLRVRPV
jgi:Zn-dependent protease/CBS domain-containing protein